MDFSNESRNLQIANYLQTLRLEQNMTLEQLSDASHVPIVHLTSIEDGRFNRFDDFYLKMYLKKYTQALGINLEQLYAYAIQQPIEDIPKQPNDEPVEANPNSMQNKVQSQPTAIETPSRRKPQIKRSMPTTTSPLGPNYQKMNGNSNMNIGKFLIGLFLVSLVFILLFFVIDFFRNIAGREDSPVDAPVLEIPENINLDPSGEEEEDDYVEDEEPEPEPEQVPEQTDDTTIEFIEHVGNDQVFNLITSHDEIELLVEHRSGPSWIGGGLRFEGLFINSSHNETNPLEETFSIENDTVFRLTLGAIQAVDTILINGVEVPFVSDGLTAPQNLDFHIVIE